MYYEIGFRNFRLCIHGGFDYFCLGTDITLGIVSKTIFGTKSYEDYFSFNLQFGFISIDFVIAREYGEKQERRTKEIEEKSKTRKERVKDYLVGTVLENIKHLSDLQEIRIINPSIIKERVERKIKGFYFHSD